jgi:hypothetical protein
MTAYETAQPGEAAQPGAAAQPGEAAQERPPGAAEPVPAARGGRWSVPPVPGSAFWGWAGPLLVTVFGAILRFTGLGSY